MPRFPLFFPFLLFLAVPVAAIDFEACQGGMCGTEFDSSLPASIQFTATDKPLLPFGYAWTVDGKTQAEGDTAMLSFQKEGTFEVAVQQVMVFGLVLRETRKKISIRGSGRTIVRHGIVSQPSLDGPASDAGNKGLQAVIRADPASSNPLAFSFSALGSLTGQSELVSYLWSFGDGTTGEGASLQHTYEKPGVYLVELIITDRSNFVSRSTLQVTAGASTDAAPQEGEFISLSIEVRPDPFFSAPETVLSFSVRNAADVEEAKFEWSFGDGEREEGSQASHAYTKEGVYDLQVEARVHGQGVGKAFLRLPIGACVDIEGENFEKKDSVGVTRIPFAVDRCDSSLPVTLLEAVCSEVGISEKVVNCSEYCQEKYGASGSCSDGACSCSSAPSAPLPASSRLSASLCEGLHVNGESAQKYDVVFLPWGFSSEETARAAIEAAIDWGGTGSGQGKGLFSTPTMKASREKFNLWFAKTLDADLPCGDIAESAACEAKAVQVVSSVARCPDAEEVVVVAASDDLVRIPLQGFSGPVPVYFAGGKLAVVGNPASLAHEWGHSVGLSGFRTLEDEYFAPDFYEFGSSGLANVDVKGCPKWCSQADLARFEEAKSSCPQDCPEAPQLVPSLSSPDYWCTRIADSCLLVRGYENVCTAPALEGAGCYFGT